MFELCLPVLQGSVHHLFPMQVYDFPMRLSMQVYEILNLPMLESLIRIHPMQGSLNQMILHSKQEFDWNLLLRPSRLVYDLRLLDMQESVTPFLRRLVFVLRSLLLRGFCFPMLDLIEVYLGYCHDHDLQILRTTDFLVA